MHLYIHVPFCARRCSYCDFAISVRPAVPSQEFVSAIARELEIRGLGGDALGTVYLGGGTPSKLGGPGVLAMLDVVRSRFAVRPDAEVTLEANPEDVSRDAVRAWRDAGVNRVSLGAQTFDDAALAWMHRTHDAAAIARAVEIVRAEGIANLSLDLIFALPRALGRNWDRDLASALALAPEHLSVYGLTVESSTPLGKWTARGDVRELPDDDWADEYFAADAALRDAGYTHYEVSNYAREGFRSRHNQSYWLDHSYLGVGPSAHGFDGTVRRWNERAYARWLARVTAGEDPVGGSERLTADERRAERVYLGLRSDAGLHADSAEIAFAQPWIDAGWARIDARHESRTLILTASGWARLDALASALTSFRSH